MAERRRKTDPEIVELPARIMAEVRTAAAPNELGERVLKVLHEEGNPLKVDLCGRGVGVWEYGTVAQILRVGSYEDEPPTMARLDAYLAEQGCEIARPHEKEHHSRPGEKELKTVIGSQARRKAEA